MRRLAFAAVLVAAAAGRADADDPVAQLRLERGQPHAGVPFTLDLIVEGFDESPAPEQPKLAIAGAHVTPLGGEPNVRRSIQIVNGRRSDSTSATWIFRWRVDVDKPGSFHVPALTVAQGAKRATAREGDVTADSVPTTDDMKLELGLPTRPVFVGETIDVTMAWTFRRQPEDQTFAIPLMTLPDFTISVPPVTDKTRALALPAGAKELQVPYDVDQVDVGGTKWNRVTLRFFVAPKLAGKVEIPAASVVAALAYGRADFFGNAPTRLFRTSDTARTLEVKPLPQSDRPASFAGAVGTQFSMQVATSRSVVQLGEPVELAITVKSNQRLDMLSLGKLDRDGGLPKDRFVVPAEPPTGELADDGKTKTFKVTAQVIGGANEIPALAFSYFDPVKGAYQTVHSDPIALSVKGGTMVGAGDVIAAAPKHGTSATPAETELALVGADLALSTPAQAEDRPFGGGLLWLLVGLLYAIPLALFGARSWQLRTASSREEAAEVRVARQRAFDELARATKLPAREAAGPLAAALRGFARVLDRNSDDGGVLAKIETESFAPGAADAPLSAAVRDAAEALVRTWIGDARSAKAKTKTKAGGAAAAGIVVLVLGAGMARAAGSPVPTRTPTGATAAAVTGERALVQALSDGRNAYEDAMATTDASARKAAFSRAAAALGDAARLAPGRPELLADWGNAALGAGDVATATLAYRRALVIDGGNARAHRNLAWLRSRQPDTFRPATSGAADTLLFFHAWPRPRKLLVGALAFALAILLVVPWSGRRRRRFVGLAVVPLAVWGAMLVSAVLADTRADDAVVMDGVVLRAADSAGAPAAMVQPLPRGAEVTVLERRDAWTKIRLPSGTAGWVPGGAVERIAVQ